MVKKRFIAGAVCPRCAEMDKIIMYEDNGVNFRECVRCDYKDEMPLAGGAGEISTRVNETSARPQGQEQEQEQEQVLTLVDPAEEKSTPH